MRKGVLYLERPTIMMVMARVRDAVIKFGGWAQNHYCKNIKFGSLVQDRHMYYMQVENFGGF